MESKKRIGILELGYKSTDYYLKLLGRKGVFTKSNFTIIPTDFEKINNLLPYPSPALTSVVQPYVEKIVRQKVDAILIPNITLHETLDKIWSSLNIGTPIIHPLGRTADLMKKQNKREAIIFGSTFTMNANYAKHFFSERGITVQAPKIEDQNFIDQVRRSVYSETATADLLEKFNDLIAAYSENSVVLMACTELSIANTHHTNNGVIDFVDEQIAGVMELLGGS